MKNQRFFKAIEHLKIKFNSPKITPLSKGGYGEVYEIILNNRRFAVKLLDLEELITNVKDQHTKETNQKMINNEIFYTLMLNNKHCLKGISRINHEEEKVMSLLLNFCENLDFNYLKKLFYNNKIFRGIKFNSFDYPYTSNQIQIEKIEMNSFLKKPNEIFLRYFIIQILKGLNYLTQNGLVHCDIKPKNILLTKDFLIKIGDLGTLKSKADYKNIPNISTKTFQAPEFRLGLKNKIFLENVEKLDIYALGCTCFDFYFNQNFLSSEELDKIEILKSFEKKYKEKKVENKGLDCPEDYLNFPKNSEELDKNKILEYYEIKYMEKIVDNKKLDCSEDFRDFLKGTLNTNIDKRFSINQSLEHKWINRGENFNYFTEMHDNDSIKFLLVLQTIEYSSFLQERLQTNIFPDKEIELMNVKEDYEIFDLA